MTKFGPDPFSREPGARLYRTGDRARFLPEGNVEHLGRVDLQVKVRGFRIEPEEIETVLSQHARVAQAAVTSVPDEKGDGRLAAYLVPVDGTDLSIDELREFLATRLPEYMVPAVYVQVDDLPRGPGGKVDRRALTEMEGVRLTLERAYVAPRDPLEAEIAEMWSEILAVERVGVHDDFFDLGGHSLLATQLVSRIRDRFHVEVPLRKLWEAPTVARLSLHVTQSLAEQEDEQVLGGLLDELGQLSDQEVQALLSDEAREIP
jgi:acyl carrier protein